MAQCFGLDLLARRNKDRWIDLGRTEIGHGKTVLVLNALIGTLYQEKIRLTHLVSQVFFLHC